MKDQASIYNALKAKLQNVLPDFEIAYKAEIASKVLELKQKRRAVILGHAYMEPALYYSVCDFTGDSLELSKRAATTDAKVIVFCGVKFMAETAKVLNPKKTVLMPAIRAGCSLAESIAPKELEAIKARYPGVPVVSYINTYADIKALSDACCTSSNAANVIQAMNAPRVIFLPDAFLAANTAKELGKKIAYAKKGAGETVVFPDADDWAILGWQGSCEVHDRFQPEDVKNLRAQFPEVAVLAHPECKPEVTALCDFVGSTSAMARYVAGSPKERFALLTECAMGENVQAANPSKEIVRLCAIRCPHMNAISLEATLRALQENRYEIDVPEPTRKRALGAVQRMLAVG